MEFFSSHWHCVLPVIGIGVALFFMRDKNKDKRGNHSTPHNTKVIPQDDRD